jgi:hypothetical protein
VKQFKRPHILLINPWIHDFAAYNLWSRPLGLLEIGGILRDTGFRVSLIDCVDAENFSVQTPYHPNVSHFGAGKLKRTPIEKPEILSDIPRRFCRYGITLEDFRQRLTTLPKPGLILVTSIMTYWYPGVRESIKILKEQFPETPIWLGGVYATLLPGHAWSACRPDRVFEGPFSHELLKEITSFLGKPDQPILPSVDLKGIPFWEGYQTLRFLCIRTSHGCPFRCPYCASHLLNPRFIEQPIERLAEEVVRLHRRFKIQDFAFYDDALLINASTRLIPFLEDLLGRELPLRFHTPNGIHIRLITREIASLMKQSGFRTLRLSLETIHPGMLRRLGSKVTLEEFDRALEHLFTAGFTHDQIKVYLLVGLPGQTFKEVVSSAEAVMKRGVRPSLAEYSPIPGTALWEEALRVSPYPLTKEPLTHNNILLPCGGNEITKEKLDQLKRWVQESFRSRSPEDRAMEAKFFPQKKTDQNHS